MRISLPINGPSKQDRSIQVNNQRSINMFCAFKNGDAKADVIQYSHAGIEQVAVAGLGPHRANPILFNNKQYWISGSEVISQNTSDTFTSIGTILTSGSRVVMAAGRNYFVLVDGTYGYYSDGNTVTRIVDSDFPTNPTHITYLNGYFPVNNAATDDFYVNQNTEDPINWSALDFATANANPDKGLALITNSGVLNIFGSETMQNYFNSGNADFPFDPYPGALPVGILAPHSLISSAYGLFWLGTNKEGECAIVRSQGGQFSKISDAELTWQINQLNTKSDAIAWIRRQGGQTFYEITFPADNKTWSINVDADYQSSELKSFGLDRFRGNCYGFFNGNAYVGDYFDGTIYKMDYDIYTDKGQSFIRTRRTRVIHKDGVAISFRSLILDAESGVGLITGQGSSPQVMMRYSVDGGRTFSSELWRSLGEIGHPEYKPTWTNLGHGYDWVFEFSCSDPVKFNLFNLFADVEFSRQ